QSPRGRRPFLERHSFLADPCAMARLSHTSLRVSGQRDSILVAGDFVQRLQFVQDPFFDSLSRLPGNRGLDLARIAAGIYAIDRITKRDFAGNDLGSRSLSVEFQVSEPEFWRQSDIFPLVTELLEFLSGDSWHLTFVPENQAPTGDGH